MRRIRARKPRGGTKAMPPDVEITKEANHVRLTLRGPLSKDAALAAIARLYRDEGFDPKSDLLCDITEASIDMRSQFEIREIIRFAKLHALPGRQGKTAIVSADDAVFGMMRMLQSYAEGDLPVRIAVFRDPEAALRWFEGR
jgi:hypothetical protein